MAWALAIFKYVPDVWPKYKEVDPTYHGFDKYNNRIRIDKYHDNAGNTFSNFLDFVLGYFRH